MSFLLNHEYELSIVIGVSGFYLALAAVFWPRRKAEVRLTDFHSFSADDLAALLRQKGAL